MRPRPPTYTLFPYTTLFRSAEVFLVQVLGENVTVRAGYAAWEAKVQALPDISDFRLRFSGAALGVQFDFRDRKSTRLNSSHITISYAVFCLKKKKNTNNNYY